MTSVSDAGQAAPRRFYSLLSQPLCAGNPSLVHAQSIIATVASQVNPLPQAALYGSAAACLDRCAALCHHQTACPQQQQPASLLGPCLALKTPSCSAAASQGCTPQSHHCIC